MRVSSSFLSIVKKARLFSRKPFTVSCPRCLTILKNLERPLVRALTAYSCLQPYPLYSFALVLPRDYIYLCNIQAAAETFVICLSGLHRSSRIRWQNHTTLVKLKQFYMVFLLRPSATVHKTAWVPSFLVVKNFFSLREILKFRFHPLPSSQWENSGTATKFLKQFYISLQATIILCGCRFKSVNCKSVEPSRSNLSERFLLVFSFQWKESYKNLILV